MTATRMGPDPRRMSAAPQSWIGAAVRKTSGCSQGDRQRGRPSGPSVPARRGAGQRPTIEPRRRYPGIFVGREPCTYDFIDHSKARADRTVHAAGTRPFVRVFTRKEHSLVERPLDLAEHSLPLIAYRGTGDAASERIVRPAHHRASQSGHSAPGDFGQRGVDVTEHIVLSEAARLRLGTEDGRNNRRA